MNSHNRLHRNAPLYSLQWRKEFAIRQRSLYRGQDIRLILTVSAQESVIEVFFWKVKPALSPPHRHELLKRFLEQTRAQKSYPNGDRWVCFMANGKKKKIAMVDDRCDPSLDFMNLSGNASFVPIRQWGSDEYMRRPPEGLHVQIHGFDDANKLYNHLNENVSPFFFPRFCHKIIAHYFRE